MSNDVIISLIRREETGVDPHGNAVYTETETLVETLYTSCIVDNLLLAGKERMACRAYINAEILAES